MFSFISSRLSSSQRARLKSFRLKSKRLFTKWFLSYGPSELESLLKAIGIKPGDTVMLHAAFADSGFRGSPKELADVFLRTIGPSGNLLMVSMPYGASTYEYLQAKKTFDVRKTPSHMGMVSESFRRREGVLRSFNPSHPILALGPKAEWIVSDHDKCLYSCGPGSPFEKMAQLGAQVIVFHVRYPTITFFHYVEHVIQELLPFPLYLDETFDVPAIDINGNQTTIATRVFAPNAINRRRPLMLLAELEKRGLAGRKRVGNSHVLRLAALDILTTGERMIREGRFFYDLT